MPYHRPIRSIVGALLICLSSSVALGGTWHAALESVPRASAISDRLDSQNTPPDLLNAALAAGGVTQRDIHIRAHDEIATVLLGIGTHTKSNETALTIAARIFAAMHREILTGPYQRSCYRLDDTLTGGAYNCVTSTVLYIYLCRRTGIPAQAVARGHHVFCHILVPSPYTVQTTCPDWFSHVEAAHLAPDALVNDDTATVRRLTDTQLLAKVHYNRAVSRAQAMDYETATCAFQQALELDPDDTSARRNLVATWNNWALQLCSSGNYRRAAGLLARGLCDAPDNANLLANDVYVHQQWLETLCRQHRYLEAREVLDRAYQRRPNVALFDQGRATICGRWAEWLVAEGRVDQALAVLANACDEFPRNAALREYRDDLVKGLTQFDTPQSVS